MTSPSWMQFLKPHKLDCSYPDLHAEHHHLHPNPHPQSEARLICYVCHPPVAELERRRREQAAQ